MHASTGLALELFRHWGYLGCLSIYNVPSDTGSQLPIHRAAFGNGGRSVAKSLVRAQRNVSKSSFCLVRFGTRCGVNLAPTRKALLRCRGISDEHRVDHTGQLGHHRINSVNGINTQENGTAIDMPFILDLDLLDRLGNAC